MNDALGKCYLKTNSLQIADVISNNSEKCSIIQKEHSKYLGKEVEVKRRNLIIFFKSHSKTVQDVLDFCKGSNSEKNSVKGSY